VKSKKKAPRDHPVVSWYNLNHFTIFGDSSQL
jgi:hypothetical protein